MMQKKKIKIWHIEAAAIYEWIVQFHAHKGDCWAVAEVCALLSAILVKCAIISKYKGQEYALIYVDVCFGWFIPTCLRGKTA